MAAPDPCYIPPRTSIAYGTLTAAGLPLSLLASAKIPKNIEFHLAFMRMLREIRMCVVSDSTYPAANIPIRTTGGLCIGTVTSITTTSLTDSDQDFSTPKRCGTTALLTGCFVVIYVKDDPRFICRASITGTTGTITINFDAVDWVARGQIAAISDCVGLKYIIYKNGDLDQYDMWPECPNSFEYVGSDSGQTTLNGLKKYQPGAYAYFPSYALVFSGNPTGTYTISVTAGASTTTTSALAASASTSDIQTALQALANVGDGKAFAFKLFDGSIGLAFAKSLGSVSVTVTPTLAGGSLAVNSVTDLLVDLAPIWATTGWLSPKPKFPDKPTAFDLVIYDNADGGDNKVHRFSISTVPGKGFLGTSFSGFQFSQGAYYSIIKRGGIWHPFVESVPRKVWYRGLYAGNTLTHLPDDSIGTSILPAVSIVINSCDSDCENPDCNTPLVNIMDKLLRNDCCNPTCCSDADKIYTPKVATTIRWVQTQLMNPSGSWIIPGYAGGTAPPHPWNFPEAMAIASAAEVAAHRPALSAFTTSVSSIVSGKAYIGIAMPYDGVTLYWTTLDSKGGYYSGGINQLHQDGTGVYMTGISSDEIGLVMKGTFGFTRYSDLELLYDTDRTHLIPSVSIDDVGTATAVDPPGISDASGPATATAAAVAGAITSTIITDGGDGYVTVPMVLISDLTGTGAIIKATIAAGAVSALTIIEPGTGYTLPTLSFKGGGELLIGDWFTKPASTTYSRFETGQMTDGGPAIAAGDLAALRRDNAMDPTLPSFNPISPGPLLPYRDYQFSGGCGKTPPNPDYKFKETDLPASGQIVSVGRTGGYVTQIKMTGANFYDYWYTIGGNILITLSGVVSTGGGTTFTGTLSVDGMSFGAMAGSPWLSWASWAKGMTVQVSRTVGSVTTIYRTLTTTAVVSTGIVTVQGLDGFSFTAGDVWKIEVPRYEIDRHQGHRALITKASGAVTVRVKANDQHVAFIDPADMLTMTDAEAVGASIKIITYEGGDVLKRDPTNTFWTAPTGTDNRTDPITGKKPKFKKNLKANLPFHYKAYGPICIGDMWGPWIFNEIRAINATLTDTINNNPACRNIPTIGAAAEDNVFSFSFLMGGGPATTPPPNALPTSWFSTGYNDAFNGTVAQFNDLWTGDFTDNAFGGNPDPPSQDPAYVIYPPTAADNQCPEAIIGIGAHTFPNQDLNGTFIPSGPSVSKSYAYLEDSVNYCFPCSVTFWVHSIIAIGDPNEGIAEDWPNREVYHFDAQGTSLAYRQYVSVSGGTLASGGSSVIFSGRVGNAIPELPIFTKPDDPTGHGDPTGGMFGDFTAGSSVISGFAVDDVRAVRHYTRQYL